MSDTVERRILAMLDNPTESPFGNPIPGLEELVPGAKPSATRGDHWVSLDKAAGEDTVRVTVRRIGESAQVEPETVALLQRAGIVPGGAVRVQRAATGVLVGSAGEYVELPGDIASQVAVEPIG